MHLSITYHAIDFILGETAGSGDGDLLLTLGRLVTCCNTEYAVSIDVEGYLNLRDATWSRGNAFEVEMTEALVVSCQFTLTLQYVDLHCRLIIFRSAKDFAL